MSDQPLVNAKNLYKVFGRDPQRAIDMYKEGKSRSGIFEETGNVLAVADVSLSVASGELFIVMGLSGSGKSTLVRLINRLITPTAGTVEVDGRDIGKLSRRELYALRASRVSMVFQRFGLLPHWSVIENVAYGLEVQGVSKTNRIQAAASFLKAVGLEGWEYMSPAELSGGMQQRVGLARALATDANILLMDEPFSALDPLVRNEMQGLLRDLQSKYERTIIFITHDFNEAATLGDRIAIMKDGAVVQIGRPGEVVLDPVDDYVAAFAQEIDRAHFLTAGMVCREIHNVVSLHISPSVALETLATCGATDAFVVDDTGGILGKLSAERIRQAGAARMGSLEQVELDETVYVSADAPVRSVAERLISSGEQVIAVVDEEGRATGEITLELALAATISM